MAQSYVPFLDSLSATRKFHTIQRSNGTDTVEQYVQLLGEAHLLTYTIVTGAVGVVGANSHPLEIMAGSTYRVGVQWIYVTQAVNATSTQQIQWQVFRLNSAGTGGGAVTPGPTDPADAASGATAMTLPTVKGTETGQIWNDTKLVHATIATVGINSPGLMIDFRGLRHKALWIAAGTSNGVALKNVTSDAACTVRIMACIVESPEGA
jgi:hypothetical protein